MCESLMCNKHNMHVIIYVFQAIYHYTVILTLRLSDTAMTVDVDVYAMLL